MGKWCDYHVNRPQNAKWCIKEFCKSQECSESYKGQNSCRQCIAGCRMEPKFKYHALEEANSLNGWTTRYSGKIYDSNTNPYTRKYWMNHKHNCGYAVPPRGGSKIKFLGGGPITPPTLSALLEGFDNDNQQIMGFDNDNQQIMGFDFKYVIMFIILIFILMQVNLNLPKI